MSHLITVVRRKGDRATAMTDYRSNESQVRQTCANLVAGGAYAVALHSLTEDAVASVVARWENGKSKRNASPANIPEPSRTIEGEVAPGTADLEYQAEGTVTMPAVEVSGDDESHHYEGQCMKCKAKREFVGHVKELANGSKAAMGNCPVCGTKITRMVARTTPVDEWTEEPSVNGVSELLPGGTPQFSDADKAAIQKVNETLNGVAQEMLNKTPRKRTPKAKENGTAPETAPEVKTVECPECNTQQEVKPLPGNEEGYVVKHIKGTATCKGSRRVVKL